MPRQTAVVNNHDQPVSLSINQSGINFNGEDANDASAANLAAYQHHSVGLFNSPANESEDSAEILY